MRTCLLALAWVGVESRSLLSSRFSPEVIWTFSDGVERHAQRQSGLESYDQHTAMHCSEQHKAFVFTNFLTTCFHHTKAVAEVGDAARSKDVATYLDIAKGRLTKLGEGQICVAGPDCVEAVTDYHAMFVEGPCGKRESTERANMDMAIQAQEAAGNCTSYGNSASRKLDDEGPAKSDVGQSLSLDGCYHDYPACLPFCLDAPPKEKSPGVQKSGRVYKVQSTCYKALKPCQGCLLQPKKNDKHLAAWQCPEKKCEDLGGIVGKQVSSVDKCKPLCPPTAQCGPDGCGGDCGKCSKKDGECVGAFCVWRPFDKAYEARSDEPVPEWYRDIQTQRFVTSRKQPLIKYSPPGH